MTQAEMAQRLGFYAGLAVRLLKDDSYAKRVQHYTHATETDIPETVYSEVTSEIHGRLVAIGILDPEEDPYMWHNVMPGMKQWLDL